MLIVKKRLVLFRNIPQQQMVYAVNYYRVYETSTKRNFEEMKFHSSDRQIGKMFLSGVKC